MAATIDPATFNPLGTDVATVGFADLGLATPLMQAISDSGYTTPTPIQAGAIPSVLAGRDVIGIAQTGTGKTASFTLPMMQILANGRSRARMPRSLVLSPTRELATQTADNFARYGKYLNLSMALLIGGVGMGDQEKVLEKGVDVLIATPGRLLDWFERGRVLLGGVNILVIDEADRMLDMGFMPDVERILSVLPNRQQTLLFSATMPPAIRRLVEKFLKEPEQIEASRPATMAENVEGFLVPIGGDAKRGALLRLIREERIGKAIVFLNRKREVSSLCRWLQGRGVNARDIHGDLEQVHRQATLDAFKSDQLDFLIATDVAARGLDISAMPCVINFDVPFNPEDYVHRIGRTGRAGLKGRAFTFAGMEDGKLVAAIERLTGKPISRHPLETADGGAGEVGEATAMPPRARRGFGRAGPERPLRGSRRGAVPAPSPVTPLQTEAEAPRSEPAPPAPAPRQPSTPPATPPAAVVSVRDERDGGDARPAGRRTRMDRGGVNRAERAASRRGAETADEPVVGLGDHVPSFLLRPVPVAKLKDVEAG